MELLIEPNSKVNYWIHANKVFRHIILCTLSHNLFDVYFSYKQGKEIWNSLVSKYTFEDVGKQKFVIEKYYKVDDKDIITQINKYQKLKVDDFSVWVHGETPYWEISLFIACL